MRYKTKVMFVTGGKDYLAGSLLPASVSAGDIAFLKLKGFVELAEVDTESGCSDENFEEDGFSGFQGLNLPILKNLDEIWKIRSKKELNQYAASIGLIFDKTQEEKSLKELQEEVINFQEEQFGGEEL